MAGFSLSQRPLVLVAGGVAIGVIVGWGVFSRIPQAQTIQAAPATRLPHEQLATTVPGSEDRSDRVTTQEATQLEPQAMQPEPQPAAKTAPQQANGLPLLPSGVTADAAGDQEVYKRLPGVPQPTINRDGRDMTAEVMSMMQVRHEPQPFPGTANSQQAPSAPLPFPQTPDEMNRVVQEVNRRAQEANAQAQQAGSPGQQ